MPGEETKGVASPAEELQAEKDKVALRGQLFIGISWALCGLFGLWWVRQKYNIGGGFAKNTGESEL